MSLPGGIRTSLVVVLLLIVGGALGGAYLMVVPSLERRLVEDRLDELQRDATSRRVLPYARQDFSEPLAYDSFVDAWSLVSNGRVVVFQVLGPPTSAPHLADSAATGGPISQDTVALEAAQTAGDRPRTRRRAGTARSPRWRSRSSRGTCSCSRRRSRISSRRCGSSSGGSSTRRASRCAIAAILGSAAATFHARRIRRLERAANRIAEGEFDEPVVDRGDDELGELAAAFERMRVQLAQLDTARKEFVANASHELRTPLFSLAGFLELHGRRGPRRRDARRVPRDDPRAGRAADEALGRPARPLADRRRAAARRAGGGRPRRRGPRARRRAHAARRGDRPPARARDGSGRAGRSPTRSACSRSGARSRATRSPTRPRGRRSGSRRRQRRRARGARGERRRAGDPARARGAHLRPLLPGRGRRTRPGAGSGSRSRASSPSGWAGTVELASAGGRTTFTLSLPAAPVAAGELAVST